MHLALIGYGSIARTVVAWLAKRPVEALTLLVRSGAIGPTLKDDALQRAAGAVQVTDDIATLIEAAPDLLVECAGQSSVADYAPLALRHGVDTVVVSVGALADDRVFRDLRSAAIEGGARLILPSGAIGGLDLLAALALAGEPEVFYRGTKPPAAWRGTAAEDHCDLAHLSRRQTFFDGSAREAARLYPKNANVAAALALACGSFDRTSVQLVADPDASGNSHSYEVRSEAGRFAVEIESAPVEGNAKTSLSTAYSVIREINRYRDPVII
ncbi:aspartate dehydrogenase [Roseobacter sinensis]|uniref:L-aspartate dehydrogenase n=1 Tax=Roseobacter sinensis TaxID=2931391 RepID=A0ABT3BL71_9RHOB|nr:aspartate dehydrogenase [Roseobacter sp. WL0113]MCV3274317.1 aspartate dehydrogenase [Roseobacter sp. WL0113]